MFTILPLSHRVRLCWGQLSLPSPAQLSLAWARLDRNEYEQLLACSRWEQPCWGSKY